MFETLGEKIKAVLVKDGLRLYNVDPNSLSEKGYKKNHSTPRNDYQRDFKRNFR